MRMVLVGASHLKWNATFNEIRVVKFPNVSELIIAAQDTLEKSDNHEFIVSLINYVKAAPNYTIVG